MENMTLDYSKALSVLSKSELESMQEEVTCAHEILMNASGKGNDFLGWVDLPENYNKEEFRRIKEAAEKIQKTAEVFIVIGIGGSYLGAKAAIDLFTGSFYNFRHRDQRKAPQIFFAGNSCSSSYLSDLVELVQDKDVCINVISKSGTTIEPAIAFRIFKDLIERKYGKSGARERIFVTTDKTKGALRELAEKEGYEAFEIADNIGGRYSVLSAVGLLPIAVCGANLDEIMQGAKDAFSEYRSPELEKNSCYRYAAIRNLLYRKGKQIEILVNYEPKLHYFAEWWKQLFGESEGKEHKGIFPAAVNFTTDLHSMGQYIQDGARNLFETVLFVKETKGDIFLKQEDENLDGLNFLAGKSVGFVNEKAFLGTVLAHVDGGTPNLVIKIPRLDEYYFGKLVYFFEKACAISGYLLSVNPFDQPGVEAYKRNMFSLLGKEGFDTEKVALEERIKE